MNPKSFTRKIRNEKFSRVAEYVVHGFLLDDTVSVIQCKSIPVKKKDVPVWLAPRVAWSLPRNQDTAADPDRILAAQCFSAAIKNACKLARRWGKKTNTPV
jgi:hypothetical protein